MQKSLKDFADEARESERSGQQQLLDALGNVFAVSEAVNVCIFCGSTKHDHADCTDPKMSDIKKVLKGIRTSLEDEAAGPDVDMGAEDKEKDASPEEAGQQEEPTEARTGEYHWYDKVLYMSEVGDLDEAGKFCIGGRNVTEEGPRSREELDDVIRDAIVRGGGDIWKVPDFMASYNDVNIRKRMYKRIEAPSDGFLKIVPNTGCYFHNYDIYSGIEIDINYRFGQNNELDPYERDVSTALNRVLRHHAVQAKSWKGSTWASYATMPAGFRLTTSSSTSVCGSRIRPEARIPSWPLGEGAMTRVCGTWMKPTIE